MPETGLHGQKYEERRTSLPIVISTRLDLQTAANEFRSSKPGSRMVGLLSLQAHCESLEGKKEILSEENLVQEILEYLLSPEVGRVPGPFETERTLQILDALTSPPKPNVASSCGAPPIALSFAERDKVLACFIDIDKGLENLVRLMNGTPMANCRVLAAKVMTNVLQGSLTCFSIAREMTGLVTVFSDLAIRGGESSDVGVEGLILLACGQRYDRYDTSDVRQRAQVLIRALMDLTRYGIALEESLVALGTVVGSFQGHVSGFLGDVSQLVSSVSGLPLGDGTYSVMEILLRMAEESTNEGQQDKSRSQGGVPLHEVVASFVPKLLEMAKRQEIEDGFAGQEECIMLLGFLRKSGGWRLEPEQVPCLFDILLQDTASNDARIEILDILAANTDNLSGDGNSNFPLAILQTSMETIVTTGLALVVKIATAIDNASTVRQKCRILSKQMETIRRVLQQIQQQQSKDRKHFSSNDKAALNALVEALRRAARVVEELTKSNKFKLTLMAASWNENLKDVSNEIQICLGSVSLMTVGLQGDLMEDLRDTADFLRKFRDEHKAESGRSAAEDAEIRKVLETVKNQENPDPMQVLAEYYNTDPESIRTDLQEFKEWRVQSKADQLYEQLLLVISELEEKSCHACTRTISSMEELQCPICRMQFTDPVIALPSGITYCRSCLNEGLLLDRRCAATRLEVASWVENRVVANILQTPQQRMARNVPSQLPPARRLDVPNAAEAFQSSSPGSILVGLTALQIHCKRVRGKKEIIEVNGLVSYLVNFALSTERERPPGSLEIALVILEDLTALNGPPEDVLGDTELEVVHICLREEGLEHLVALMCTGTANCRLRAAQVMVNAMEGSFECLCLARTLNRLVTAFYDLAVGDREGHKLGLAGLGLLAHRKFSIAENHGRKDEVVVEVLMELIRNGFGVQEALVALAQVVASSQSNSIFSTLQDGGTHLAWLVETMPAGDGRNAAVKILLFMVEDLERAVASNRGASVSSKDIPSNKVLAPRLLKIIKDLTDGKMGLGGAEEDCILLLSYVLKYGGYRLEPDQVVFLSDIVLQETASVKSRIKILEMCAENIKNMRPVFDPTRLAQLLQLVQPQLGDSTLRSGLLKMMCSLLRVPEWYGGFEGVRVKEVEDVPTCFGTFCSVAAHDTNELCRGYAIVALKILSTADHKILKQVRTTLTMEQLVQVLQSKGPDEVSIAAAALIGMLGSDTEPDSEEVVRKALMYLVELLQNDTIPFKEEAAKALVHLICNQWEVARDWVAASETNVLAGLVSFAWKLPAHSEWRGQLYESLTLMCSDTHCRPLVVQAGGQRLLMEAFQPGSHTAASQGAALALIELMTSGKPLQDVDHGTVVVAVKGKLRREKVDPTMVGAFVRLCENADTGRLVLEHGGIEVLLDVMQRSTECCSAAALGIAKLASRKPDQDDGDNSSNPHSAPCQPADRIVKAKGISILLGSAGSGCIPAAEALDALVEEPSAKVELAENVGVLSEMGKDPGRMQDLVLSVMSQLSWPDLPQQSLAKLLQGDFPDRLLGALKFPSSPSAATAMRILRELFLAFPVFRDNILNRGEGAVKELLQVLKGSPPTGLKECAVTTLEVFVLEETGRQQWIEQDGIKVVLDVLQESSVHGQVRLDALNILVSLASPPLPKPVRRRIWNQICTAQIFRAVVEELDTEALSPPGTHMAAIRLLIACVGEASHVSELCGTLREQKLPRALAKLRHYYCDEEVVAESHELVILLAGKSRRTKLALQLEIDKEDKAHKENAAERQAER